MSLDWKDLRKIAGELIDDAGRVGMRALASIGAAPHEIVPYRGFGNASRILVHGRAVASTGVGPAGANDGLMTNLVNTLRRLDSDPLRHARVHVRVSGVEREIVADDEGFFRQWIDLPPSVPTPEHWTIADLRLLSPLRPAQPDVRAKGVIRVPRGDATFGVISDLDDTIIQSRVSNFLYAAKTALLDNARTRLPFAGVAAFYQALERGGDGTRSNPVFYVSSSPWNVHDMLVEFLTLQRIPDGPVLLRDWDFDLSALAASRLHQHKEPLIREILDLYPSLPFILIGDTSQRDPEIYREIVRQYPGRILAVYVRNIDPKPTRLASVQALAKEVLDAGSSLLLADDTAAAARHAAERGWIASDSVREVDEEARADLGKTGEKSPAPGVGPSPGAPTIEVG
jgi:phosphatidate phosphatase APP1